MNMLIKEKKMEALFLLIWPLVIYLSYKFIMLNINQLEKDKNYKKTKVFWKINDTVDESFQNIAINPS